MNTWLPPLASSISALHLVVRQGDGQQAVLEAVVVEDVGEAGGDHAADAEVHQRPGGVLAARAAAEVVAGRSARRRRRSAGWLSTKSGFSLAVAVEAQVVEQALGQALALHGLEELLGDDLVGVDVGDVERRGLGGEMGEGCMVLAMKRSIAWVKPAAMARPCAAE